MNRAGVLAERRLILQQSDLTRKTIVIQLGYPYWVIKGVEAACPVSIHGLYEDLHDAHGVDLYQALELAIQLVNNLLETGVSSQETLLWPNGERYGISRGKPRVSTTKVRKKCSSPPK